MRNRMRAGDLVEVRSAAEILPTLDDDGCLDRLPFMPEMLPHIGRRYRVVKRAHKTCDTVHQTGGRRLDGCVHLDNLRCDGASHDGCKAMCLLFWKEAWLKHVDPTVAGTASDKTSPRTENAIAARSLEERIRKNTRTEADRDTPVYRCQATALYDATRSLPWYDLRQYVEDLTSGNTRILRMLRVLFFHALHKLMGLGVGYRLWRAVYDSWQSRSGGYTYPFQPGRIPEGERTPGAALDLQPGEKVRVRSHDEILATISTAMENRGMRFDPEMVPFCGRTFTVSRRVDRIIHETTGRMITMKSPGIILEGVVCRSEMSECRLFCPRAIPSYWREIWLERVDADATRPAQQAAPSAQ